MPQVDFANCLYLASPVRALASCIGRSYVSIYEYLVGFPSIRNSFVGSVDPAAFRFLRVLRLLRLIKVSRHQPVDRLGRHSHDTLIGVSSLPVRAREMRQLSRDARRPPYATAMERD